MIPMVRKLTAYAAYCGQAVDSARVSWPDETVPAPTGSRLNTRMVMATAKTPSLKDSARRESTRCPPAQPGSAGPAGPAAGSVGAPGAAGTAGPAVAAGPAGAGPGGPTDPTRRRGPRMNPKGC